MTLILMAIGLTLTAFAVGLVMWQRQSIEGVSIGSTETSDNVALALVNSEAQPERNLQEVIRRLEVEHEQRRKVSILAKVAARLTPPNRALVLEQRILQSAQSENWTLGKLFEFKLMGMLIGFFVGALAVSTMGAGALSLGIMVGLSVFGFVAVDLSLDRRANDRQRAIEIALPDMLDQMVISVEAGLGLESALARIARTNDNPLADEFNRTLRDMRMGATRGNALRALLERIEVQDLRLFIRALIQADRGGVPIAGVCRVQADEARNKRRQNAEERAMKMPVKLVFPLILCILPALFLVVLGPAVINITSSGFL